MKLSGACGCLIKRVIYSVWTLCHSHSTTVLAYQVPTLKVTLSDFSHLPPRQVTNLIIHIPINARAPSIVGCIKVRIFLGKNRKRKKKNMKQALFLFSLLCVTGKTRCFHLKPHSVMKFLQNRCFIHGLQINFKWRVVMS